METLLLTIVIILQFVLIFLIIQREYRLLPDGLVMRYQPQSLQDKTEREKVSSENLWDNPPTASERKFMGQSTNRIRRIKIDCC